MAYHAPLGVAMTGWLGIDLTMKPCLVRQMANQSDLDDTFRALADPTRRAIVARLTTGEARIGELAEPFSMALPSFLDHVRKLEGAGLVTTRKEGRARICTLNASRLDEAERWISRQRALWNVRFDRLEALLDEDPGNAS